MGATGWKSRKGRSAAAALALASLAGCGLIGGGEAAAPGGPEARVTPTPPTAALLLPDADVLLVAHPGAVTDPASLPAFLRTTMAVSEGFVSALAAVGVARSDVRLVAASLRADADEALIAIETASDAQAASVVEAWRIPNPTLPVAEGWALARIPGTASLADRWTLKAEGPRVWATYPPGRAERLLSQAVPDPASVRDAVEGLPSRPATKPSFLLVTQGQGGGAPTLAVVVCEDVWCGAKAERGAEAQAARADWMGRLREAAPEARIDVQDASGWTWARLTWPD